MESKEQKMAAVIARFLMDGLMCEVSKGPQNDFTGGQDPVAAFLDAFEDVQTFSEAGVLTRDHGFVIRLDGGRKFTVTIGRAR